MDAGYQVISQVTAAQGKEALHAAAAAGDAEKSHQAQLVLAFCFAHYPSGTAYRDAAFVVPDMLEADLVSDIADNLLVLLGMSDQYAVVDPGWDFEVELDMDESASERIPGMADHQQLMLGLNMLDWYVEVAFVSA